LRFLEELTALDPHGIKLTKAQIQEAINRLKDLEILEDNRCVTQGSEDWHFTLKLWYGWHDQKVNLEQFDREWERHRLEKPRITGRESTETSPNTTPGGKALLSGAISKLLPRHNGFKNQIQRRAERKLAVLKIWDSSFEQGFPVTLQIGEDERPPSLEIIGRLPPAPEILQYYNGWATAYRSMGSSSRLEASVEQVTNVSKVESCCNAAQVLRDRLNTWLFSESFRPIREKLLEQLSPLEEIRLIIQTENIWLQRLPWHLWDFCDLYPKAEIALSPPSYEHLTQISSSHSHIRILAILGSSTGINVQADRHLLEILPDAEVRFLVEPQRYELSEELWTQSWDILFFAGHSSSQCNGEIGRIYLNQTDSLTFEELKFSVRRAVERGLKIAIFNSCDGLGLARDLAELKIPQTVIMREPVPDRVSQDFLKYFLDAFSSGQSFYLAVRDARERLQGLEDQFPCATWLPVIFQNAPVVPPTWNELRSWADKHELGEWLTRIPNTTEELAKIRTTMLVAKTIWELRSVLYEIDRFLAKYPYNVEARLLRHTVLAAQQREKDLQGIDLFPCSAPTLPSLDVQKPTLLQLVLRLILILLTVAGLLYLLYILVRYILEILK
jgi:hypothetical protein